MVVALCSDIYVGTGSGRISKYDKDGNLLIGPIQHLGSALFNDGNFYNTPGIVVDSTDQVFLCTTTGEASGVFGHDCIQKLDSSLGSSGEFFDIATYFGLPNTGQRESAYMSLGIDKQDNLLLLYGKKPPSGSAGILDEWHLLQIDSIGTVLNDWLPDVELGTITTQFGTFPVTAQYPKIDLACDGSTMYYTLGVRSRVYRFDIVLGTQLSRFLDSPVAVPVGGEDPFRGMRVYPNGDVLICNEVDVVKYNSTAILINTYSDAGMPNPFDSLTFGENIATFWSDVNTGAAFLGVTLKKWQGGVVVLNLLITDPNGQNVNHTVSCAKPKDICRHAMPFATVVGAN